MAVTADGYYPPLSHLPSLFKKKRSPANRTPLLLLILSLYIFRLIYLYNNGSVSVFRYLIYRSVYLFKERLSLLLGRLGQFAFRYGIINAASHYKVVLLTRKYRVSAFHGDQNILVENNVNFA